MKLILIYEDYINSEIRRRIRKEYDNNDVVILDGGPRVYIVNEEFEEIIIEDYNSRQ